MFTLVLPIGFSTGSGEIFSLVRKRTPGETQRYLMSNSGCKAISEPESGPLRGTGQLVFLVCLYTASGPAISDVIPLVVSIAGWVFLFVPFHKTFVSTKGTRIRKKRNVKEAKVS